MRTTTHSPTPADWSAAARVVGDGLLSILMPAYRLETVLAANLRHVCAALRGRIPFEIVVVDDGSPDGTAAAASDAAGDCPEVRVVRLEANRGKGEALRQGFRHARGSHILFLDADLDLPPEQVWRFFTEMDRTAADVVIGSKMHPDSRLQYPLARRIASRTYFLLVKLLIGLPIHDTQTGLKLFRREVLEWVFPRILVKRFAFDLEVLTVAHRKGWRIVEAPVTVEFHARLGMLTPHTVQTTLNDTLAVFYRARLLRYYESVPDLPAPDPLPRVSIVIAYPVPTPNLDEALAAIAKLRYPDVETILLPDAPSGRAWPAGVREIPTGKVRPAEKRNRGVAAADGAIIAFLDDDAAPVPDWLDHAIRHFTDDAVAAVGGPGITPSSDGWLAQQGGRVYENPLVSGNFRYRYLPERVRDVDDFPSCNLLVRRSVMEDVGGFRTDFWPGEDTILCRDIVHKLHRTIRYEPWATVLHHRRPLFLPHLRQVGRYALHRGAFVRRFPETSRRIGYMAPSLFVVGLLVGGALAWLGQPWRGLYLAGLAVYGALTFVSCLSRDVVATPVVWLGVLATHVVYGMRFLQGLLTHRLPAEVRDFDHSSARAP